MSQSWTADVHRHVLPNGLTLLVQARPGSGVTAVVTHVKAGYFDEPDRWTGIAHVLEHMFFKGTERRGPGEIARQTKRLGGYVNASTSYDRTQYYAVVPAEATSAAIDIQCDALLHSVIDPDELQRELEVIIQEAKRKLDSPGAVTTETLYSLLFDCHRMRRWRIGSEEGLRSFTPENVREFYRTRYVPSRTIVAVVGDIDPAATLEHAGRAYASMPTAELAADPSPSEPEREDFRAKWLAGDVRQTTFALGWRTFSALDSRTPALDLASWVLSHGRGSWGYRVLQAPGLVNRMQTANYTPTEVGVFQAVGETTPDLVLDALVRAWAVVRRLREAGPNPCDLLRAKALLETAWARRLETVEGRSTALAEFEALGSYRLADQYRGQLATTSAAQVVAAMASLTPSRAAVVVYAPRAGGHQGWLDGLEQRLHEADSPVLTWPSSPPPPSGRRQPRGAARDEHGTTLLETDACEILARGKPGVPLVTLGAVVLGAGYGIATDRGGLGLLAARAALRGAGPYDGDSLALALEQVGGSSGVLATPDWFGWYVTARSPDLDRAAALLAVIAGSPRFDDRDVEIERDLLAREAERSTDDMMGHPIRLARAAAFAGDSYGVSAVGTPESVRGLTPTMVRDWHRRHLAAGRITLVVVGDLEAERAVDQLAARFDGWNGTARPAADPPRLQPGRRVVETRDKAQTAFALGYPAPSRSSRERHATALLAGLAGGLGGRLFEELRSKRSLAYTVATIPWLWRRAGIFFGYMATAPQRAEEGMNAMRAELEALAKGPISAEELERAKRYHIGLRRIRRQSGSSVALEVLEAHLAGAGVAELVCADDEIEAVTADELLRAAASALSAEPVIAVIEAGPNAGSAAEPT